VILIVVSFVRIELGTIIKKLKIQLAVAQGIASLAAGLPQARLHKKVTELQGSRFSPVIVSFNFSLTDRCRVLSALGLASYYMSLRCVDRGKHVVLR